MLDSVGDAQIVRRWLTAALDQSRDRPGLSAADLARYCKVTVQAVNGWKKTGRITKTNLQKATVFFGHGPDFSKGPACLSAAEPPNVYEVKYSSAWPFQEVSISRVLNLPPSERSKIGNYAAFVVAQWEAESHEGNAA